MSLARRPCLLSNFRRLAVAVCCCVVDWGQPATAAAPPDVPEVTVVVPTDFRDDKGQSLGTLFEAWDDHGRPIAGAGFVDAYNTQDRSDRRLLQVYVNTAEEPPFVPEKLPRPTTDAGTYLFGFKNRLYSYGRGGADGRLRVWDGRHWQPEDAVEPLSVETGEAALALSPQAIRFDGAAVVQAPDQSGALAEPYYAGGWLVWRQFNGAVEPPVNQLFAAPWNPGESAVDRTKTISHTLGTPREFVYCYGQHGDRVLAATNTGGVFVLDKGVWQTVRATDPKVSFQIYSSLSLGDRLLLGQYPSGEIWTLEGLMLQRRSGWPPVMPGVRGVAREAQTLSVYAGKIYAGVWPWGEVWRMDPHDQSWRFLGRMFTHPQPTDATTHPYENETKDLDPVLNRWGQRVTSLTPWGDSLYIATSAKGPNPYEKKFNFMTPEQADEYGAVYRHREPGCVSVPFNWRQGGSQFAFRWTPSSLTVFQDGETLGRAVWPAASDPRRLLPARVNSGSGLYGQHPVSIQAKQNTHARRAPLCVYVDLNRVFDAQQPPAERERQIDAMLDRVVGSGLTTVMPYANTSSGKVYYPSAVNSRHAFPDWDPLGYFTAAARNRGLEVWPAFCALASGHFDPHGVLQEHPEWALRQLDGQPWGFLSPAHPEARAWVVAQLAEIVERYSPDGLLLDYLRYFNRPYQLDAAAQAALDVELAGMADEAARRAHRQQTHERHLSALMNEIARAVRVRRPQTRLGLYTWGPHVAENHLVAQPWPAWARGGLVDLVNVSGYYYAAQNGPDWHETYERRLREALQLADGDRRQALVTVTLGVKTSHGELTTAAEIDDYLQRAGRVGVDGVGMFTWTALEPYLEGLAELNSISRFADLLPPARW